MVNSVSFTKKLDSPAQGYQSIGVSYLMRDDDMDVDLNEGGDESVVDMYRYYCMVVQHESKALQNWQSVHPHTHAALALPPAGVYVRYGSTLWYGTVLVHEKPGVWVPRLT